MTAEEFEQWYAERVGLSVAALRARGREVRPCDCGDVICDGWQMAYIDDDDPRRALKEDAP